MALKESILNLNTALRTTLQNVPAVVDTLIRGFDEIGDAAEAQVTYSTTEHIVGKWIDGSEIYEKVVDLGDMPNNTSKDVVHGISNLGFVCGIDVIMYQATVWAVTPYIFSNGYINVYATPTAITVTSTRDTSTYKGIATIRYTKSTSNRALENDTKNGGDDEPVAKTVDEPAEDLKK